jgi:Na+-translocating ferredoxin:NAD+ oxidoreductase RnfC subunit
MPDTVAQATYTAGVVGAGGAGFPTHVKLAATAEFLLVNGAECEPLLAKDKELLRREAGIVLRGAILAGEAVGAKRIICAVKETYPDVINAVRDAAAGTDIELKLLGNYYPSGDEYNLTYECTGRLIPPGGIPPAVGCVVSNVETLYNVARAVDGGIPVTETAVTVAGAVEHAVTLRVPVGTPISEVLARAGVLPDDPVVLDGGAMMGSLCDDLSQPVTKRSGGYIVLPRDHYLIKRRFMTKPQMHRKGHSACDQCSYCTELCPRYLLGYEVEPHKVMRTLLFAGRQSEEYWSRWGQLCCECNLCSLYACPEDLDPKDACVWSKETLERSSDPEPEWRPVERPHLMESERKVPIDRLVRRLGLEPFYRDAPWSTEPITPRRVSIPLKQHAGVPCTPIVAVGERVAVGQPLGNIPEGELGVPIHASIAGQVILVNDSIVLERD